MRGRTFALASIFYFLAPLVLAVLGAAAGGADPGRQVLGGGAGLAAGMVLTSLLARLRERTKEEGTWFDR